MKRLGMVTLLVAMALVAAACGARLSDEERAAYEGGVAVEAGAAGTGTAGSDGGTEAATGDAGVTEAGTDAAVGDAGTAEPGPSDAGAEASGTDAGATSGGGDAAAGPAPTAPPGGNGGATDVGVTGTEIVLGNVSTLTGPVPGLFKGAVSGAKAFVAYQNSKGGVFGRKLRLVVGDDKLSGDENRAQILKLTPQVFAFLGSFSVFDDAGAAEMGKARVPDVGYSLSKGRAGLPTNFSPQPLPQGWRLGSLNYFKQTYGDEVIKKVGALVANVDTSKQAWAGEKAAMESLGYEIVHERSFQPTETDFTADVIQMKRAGVQMVAMAADVNSFVRVAKGMAQQQMTVKLPNWGANAYDPDFIKQGGAAVEGSIIDQQLALFGGEDAAAVPEVALFNTWMKRVDPGFSPDIFAAFAWASGLLFVQALEAGGPKATRAGLVEQLKKIDNFDANGMVAPAGPATKRPPVCWLAIEVKGGKFVRKTPDKGYRCNDGGYFRLGG